MSRYDKTESPLVDASQYIIDLENEYQLFNKTIEGVYFWKLVRFALSREIEMHRGTLEKTRTRSRKKARLKQVMRFIRSIDYCPAESRVVVYEHARKVAHRGSYVDPYSWRVVQALVETNEDFCLWEGDIASRYQCDLFDAKRWFLSAYHLKSVKHRTVSHITGETGGLLRVIARRLMADLKIRIDVAELVITSLNHFIKEYAYFSYVFHNATPKLLFVVCGYGKEGLIQAAKDAGIYTVELQHGTIYPRHLGYAYPGWEKVPYFADSLAVYAETWIDDLPLKGVDVQVIGYAPLVTGMTEPRDAKKDIDILFISQWIHSDRILHFASSVAKMMPSKKVVCKLHPADAIPKTSGPPIPNLSITRDRSLNEYMAVAKYAVAVFSTGIFESLRFACLPILLDMYGVHYMEDFVKVTGAPVIDSPEAFVAFLQNNEGQGDAYRNLSYTNWFREFDASIVDMYIKKSAMLRCQ
jgi:hypothetical protein